MKKFTLSLLFAVMVTSGLFAQRTADLETILNKPTAGQVIKDGETFDLNFSIKNNGPDVIKMVDTVRTFFVINNNILNLYALKLPKDIEADSSVTFNIPLTGGLTSQVGGQSQISICMASFVFNRSSDKVIDTLYVGTNNTACATVTFDNNASVQNAITTSSLKAYPNPAKNEVTVSFDVANSSEFTINIMDINGKLVQSTNGTTTNGTNNVNMNVSELPAGVYMYQLNLDNGISTKKLIITK